MAKAQGDVDLAVVIEVEIVGRTDHGKNFTSVGFGDESGAVGNLVASERFDFGGERCLGGFLKV